MNTSAQNESHVLALRAKEAARLLGISERGLWTLTNRGVVPHVRLGRRIVYPVHLLKRWLDDRAKEVGCDTL